MVLNFARNVGNAPKEGLKMITQWVVYYFTNPKSWYPAPKVPWSCRLHWYSNVITCTDSTTEHTEDERLGKQIWCSSASDGKSWNSPVKLWSERDSATWMFLKFIIIIIKIDKFTPNSEQRLQCINSGCENHHPLKRPFELREWTKNKHLWWELGLAVRITGLRYIFSSHCRIKEPYWGPSVHRKVENHHIFCKTIIAWFQGLTLRESEICSLWKI